MTSAAFHFHFSLWCLNCQRPDGVSPAVAHSDLMRGLEAGGGARRAVGKTKRGKGVMLSSHFGSSPARPAVRPGSRGPSTIERPARLNDGIGWMTCQYSTMFPERTR